MERVQALVLLIGLLLTQPVSAEGDECPDLSGKYHRTPELLGTWGTNKESGILHSYTVLALIQAGKGTRQIETPGSDRDFVLITSAADGGSLTTTVTHNEKRSTLTRFREHDYTCAEGKITLARWVSEGGDDGGYARSEIRRAYWLDSDRNLIVEHWLKRERSTLFVIKSGDEGTERWKFLRAK